MSFLEPSFNNLGNLPNQYGKNSARYFIRSLNERLFDLTRSFSNFHFIDSNEIINAVGRMHLQDDVVATSTHASFIGDFDLALDGDRLVPPKSNFETFETQRTLPLYGQVFWNHISDNLKILRQTDAVKLIVVDLDDTLWQGVAAEVDVEDWARIEGWPLGFVEALLYFKNRGGLLAICSKNDHESTIASLNKIWRGAITVDDFVSIKINWNPKSSNIASIIAETNILPESILFIDDNPREIDEAKAQYPAIRCLGGDHYDWRRIILQSPETQVPYVTAESAQRTDLIAAGRHATHWPR